MTWSAGFYLKKVLLYLLYPSGLVLLLLAGTAIYALWGKRRGKRRAFLFLALFLYYLSCTPFLPHLLLKPLEKGFKRPNTGVISRAYAVVVLPARIYGKSGLALEERFSRETWARFMAGIRLVREHPGLHLIVVGGSWSGPGARYLARLGSTLGVKVEALDQAPDTITSARILRERLAGKPFLLVTSAHHLRRALYLFKREGLRPIPYPALYLSHQTEPVSPWFLNFLPDPVYMEITNEAVHEYLGLSFYYLRDFLKGKIHGKT
ncbi:ElyC/SanA/YdcF family protein [Thermosulfurimonas sp.]|uniref:YdcF family protein n=1 Tax=Thermosulfurimonas sp. TaxID=2080236 RepID=UPI0025DE4608|nr:ElyC/SanA/YdcF family protein [Thermosulfurimonas sp.]